MPHDVTSARSLRVQDPVKVLLHVPPDWQAAVTDPPKVQVAEQVDPMAVPLQLVGQVPYDGLLLGVPEQLVGAPAGHRGSLPSQ